MSMGAGFILYKKDDSGNGIKFLGLISRYKYRISHNGVFDIPKGSIDFGESALDCAIRECYEECRVIVDEKNVYEKCRDFSGLTIFISELKSQVPKILPNPHSGKLEHLGFTWCNPKFLYDNCFDYLKPCILWAKKELAV